MEVYEIKNSKVVLGAGYDPTTETLRLQLKSQPDYFYDYSDVSVDVYSDLLMTDSAGRYYSRYIKNHYSSKKVHVSDTREFDIGATLHNLSLDEFVNLIAEKLCGKLAKKLA